MVVTDYEHMRYASAGNVRLRLYRGSNTYIKSADMSLSQKLCQKGEIEENAISRHIERNNLYAYLGQEKNFRPYISPEIKLKNTDIIQGIRVAYGKMSKRPVRMMPLLRLLMMLRRL